MQPRHTAVAGGGCKYSPAVSGNGESRATPLSSLSPVNESLWARSRQPECETAAGSGPWARAALPSPLAQGLSATD